MVGYRDVPIDKIKDYKMRNKTQKALEDILVMTKYFKQDRKSKYYKTYWAAWNALNENINAGVYE
tara:strand:- start:272 stop:466 length:195 start_codon:yes stop_codon:yes gene_type:complete